MSPSIERLLGYTTDEIYQRGAAVWFESIHPDDVDRVTAALEALFATGQAYDVECRVRRKRGNASGRTIGPLPPLKKRQDCPEAS
jgi:PAS domain-containing protein